MEVLRAQNPAQRRRGGDLQQNVARRGGREAGSLLADCGFWRQNSANQTEGLVLGGFQYSTIWSCGMPDFGMRHQLFF